LTAIERHVIKIKKEKMMKILTVANRKGGAGKSTCAAHVAMEAVKEGLKVILIDLDPQKTLETWWNKREDDNPYLTDTSASELSTHIHKISSKKFDLCVIDTPGDTSTNAISAIKVADLVLIPSKPTAPDLTAIGRTISMVKEQSRPFVFVITQSISRSSSSLQASSVLSEFGPVAPSSIANRTAYANAMASGISASLIDKIAASEIEALWAYLSRRLFDKAIGKEKQKIS